MAHQIRTISKGRLRHPLGHLEDQQLRDAVQQAIRNYLELE
ncbi:MAG: type II toxin-antitoxin system PemK/MazF family toxin [Chloroflexota bacterium]